MDYDSFREELSYKLSPFKIRSRRVLAHGDTGRDGTGPVIVNGWNKKIDNDTTDIAKRVLT